MAGGDEDWWWHMEKERPSSLEDPRRVWGIHGVSTGCQSEEGISSMASSKVEAGRNNMNWTFQGLFWTQSHT